MSGLGNCATLHRGRWRAETGTWKADILTGIAFRDKVRYVQRTFAAYLTN